MRQELSLIHIEMCIRDSAIAAAYNFLANNVPALAAILVGGIWQVFVIFGVHWGVTPMWQLPQSAQRYLRVCRNRTDAQNQKQTEPR